MENLVTKKKEYLLSIPDIVHVIEASETVAAWFIKSKKDKPEYQLENYVCFHKDFKYGVYLIEDKFYFVSIMRPKKFFGIESGFVIQVVSEILTDDLDDSHLEKGSITGATLLRRDTDSEKAFFKAIIEYDEINLQEQSNKFQQELVQKIKDKEAPERKAKQEAEILEAERIAKEEANKEADRKAKQEAEILEAERIAKDYAKREADRKAKREAEILEAERIAKEEAERIAKEEAERFEFLTSKYGRAVSGAYKSKLVAIGMPISLVEEIKGQGHDRKRNISKQGETIKEKYGKYYKTLASGKKSSTASYEMEIEYERDESGNSWLVSSLKDL